ncbi:hypothetical protein BGW80DRAFT_1300720 [Lactifluus volemus]|nr:hypothetical protein BGW80DRAFT_1300720 [Lactifluus volemus]
MPEEVTGSVFTWLTPKLRNRMSVDTMSAMTQIRQYYQTEQKIRARSDPRPTVKFYEIKKKIFPSSDDDPSAMSDDEAEGTTDVPNASDVPDGSTNDRARAIGKEDLPYINMDTRIITDIIADDIPTPRKGEVSGGQGRGDDWTTHSSWDIASDDDDFTMEDLFRP